MVERVHITSKQMATFICPKCQILVEFYLDDNLRTLIKKKVIVRNIAGPTIGTEFAPTEAVDKALGFYMFG